MSPFGGLGGQSLNRALLQKALVSLPFEETAAHQLKLFTGLQSNQLERKVKALTILVSGQYCPGLIVKIER